MRPQARKRASKITRLGADNNRFGIQHTSESDDVLGNSQRGGGRKFGRQGLGEQSGGFGRDDNIIHHPDSPNGKFAHGGFSGKHDGIGVIEDGVRHIGNFGPRGTRIKLHRAKHLSGGDHGLTGIQAFMNNAFLMEGDLSDWCFQA